MLAGKKRDFRGAKRDFGKLLVSLATVDGGGDAGG